MSYVFVIWWCLCVLGRTEISPSSDVQMPTTDTTQDMGILAFLVNVAAALMRQPLQSCYLESGGGRMIT